MTAQGLFRAPGPRLFLRRVCDDLMARQNCAILLPAGVARGPLCEAVRGAMWNRLDVLELANDLVADHRVAPLDAVVRALGVIPSGRNPMTFDGLLHCEGLPDVVEMPALDGLDSGRLDAWLQLIDEWAAHGHRSPSSGPYRPVFLLTLEGSRLVGRAPKPEVRLAVHPWQGVVSALDLRQLWRLETRRSPGGEADAWIEHVAGSLAADDLELAMAIEEAVLRGPRTIVESLKATAERRGWTPDRARQAAASLEKLPFAGLNGWHGGRLTGDIAEGWADGIIRLTAEYGVEVSSAALALLGAEQQIRHRIWRGQAAMLLPFCDTIRLALCDDLTRRFGSEWVCWHPADDPNELNEVRQNPYSAQLGHLESILRTPLAADRAAWLAVVNAARHLRNELAHYRPVAFRDFERLCRLASQVRGARRGAAV